MSDKSKDQSSLTLSEYVIMEAHEKAYEVEIKSLKQYEKEKRAILEREREKISQEFERKMREKNMEQKISRSSQVNASRLDKMNCRNDLMVKIQNDVQLRLYERINEDKAFYKDLLKKLLVQGMISLMEKKVVVKCLEKDVQLVKEVAQESAELFRELVKAECEKDMEVEVTVMENAHLMERRLGPNEPFKLDKGQETLKCFGGVLMTDASQLIVCKNTLDVRVDLCIQGSLPDIRRELFN